MAYAAVSIGTPTNSGSPSYGVATTAGNLLICWCLSSGTTPTINQGYSTAFANTTIAIFYKANCGAGETAPTITGAPLWTCLGEFSGGATSSPLDKVSSAMTQGATTPQTNTLPSADTTSGSLVIGTSLIVLSKAGTDTTTMTMNNGATVTSNKNDATSTTIHYNFGYGITTGNSGADTISIADTSMNLSSLTVIGASFKTAATRVPRNPGIDSDLGVLCKAHQAIRRWRHGACGILIPELSFVH